MYPYMSILTSVFLAVTPSPVLSPSPTPVGTAAASGFNTIFLIPAGLAVVLLLLILVVRRGSRRGRPDGTPVAPAAQGGGAHTDLDPVADSGTREIYRPNPTPMYGVQPSEPAPPPAAPAPMPAAPTPIPSSFEADMTYSPPRWPR